MPQNTQSCWFSASDPNAVLIGGVFPKGAPTSSNPVATVTVKGSTSTPFVLSPGDYRYEFNIAGGGKFTLSLFVHGVGASCTPSSFDPNDPTLGNLAALDRISNFTVT
jgi:hypothetical protein